MSSTEGTSDLCHMLLALLSWFKRSPLLHSQPLPTAGVLALLALTLGGHFLIWLLVLSLRSSTVRVWPARPLQGALWLRDIAFSFGGNGYYQSPIMAELFLDTLGHMLSDLWLVCNFPNRRKMQQWPQNSL